MKNLTALCLALLISLMGHSQLIVTVQLEEPVAGMCGETMYALFSGFDHQQQPTCHQSKSQLVSLMNEQIEYLKTNPKAKGKGVMSIFINCRGEKIQVSSGLKDKNSELSKQIESFLRENGEWTPGIYNGQKVDCSELISIKIKKGVIYLD